MTRDDAIMLAEDMYQENILEHYKNPHNYGYLTNPTVCMKDNNPFCGDVIEIHMILKDGIIEDVKFRGHGCAISQSAASMLTDRIKGKHIDEVKEMKKEDIIEMLGIELSAVRLKCALLSLKVAKLCIYRAEGEKYEEE